MKQEFVTVGQWTLRTKDVSGVSIVPLTCGGVPDPSLGWAVRILSFGKIVCVVNCEGPNAMSNAIAWEILIEEAIGATVPE
jgi:hypothetical protein